MARVARYRYQTRVIRPVRIEETLKKWSLDLDSHSTLKQPAGPIETLQSTDLESAQTRVKTAASLRSVPEAEFHSTPGVRIGDLGRQSLAQSDDEAASGLCRALAGMRNEVRSNLAAGCGGGQRRWAKMARDGGLSQLHS